MDFEIVSEITDIETIASGVGVRDRKRFGGCIAQAGGEN